MPYTIEQRRARLTKAIDNLTDALLLLREDASPAAIKGDCNYALTRVLLGAMEPIDGWGYGSISNVASVAQDISDEIKRRMLNPYEDYVKLVNGDLPEFTRFETELNEKYQKGISPSGD